MFSKLFTQESKTIAGAAVVIGAASLLSRVLGLVRDRLLVSRIGVGDQLDAYYAAFQVPNFLFALLILGTLSAAFIPVFSGYLAQGKKDEAWRVAGSVLTVTATVMGLACAAFILFAEPLTRLVAPGFEGEKLALAAHLTRVMMLSPFLFALSAVFSGVLSSFRRFLAVSLAPLLYNASIIFGIAFLAPAHGVAGVAWAAIGGGALHMLIQLSAASSLGMPLKPVADLKHPGVREIGRLFLPRVFGVDISQVSLLVGSIVGSTVGTGAVSVFNLATNIAAVPIGLVAVPFAIAAFPDLSEAAAKGERGTFIRIFASTFRQALFLLVPLSVLAVILRVHIVRLLFGTQGLTWHETRLAAASVALLAATFAFQALTPLLARAFYALRNTVVPVLVSAAALGGNLAMTWAALGWFRGGGPLVAPSWLWLGLFGVDDLRGLALPTAYSAASVVQAVLLVVVLRRMHGRIGGAGILRALGKFALGAFAAGVAAVQVVARMDRRLDEIGFAAVLWQAVLATFAGFAAYVLVLKLLKSEELESVAGALHRRFLKVRQPIPVNETQEM